MRFLFRCLIIASLTLTGHAAPSYALSEHERELASDAFHAADQGNWSNALGLAKRVDDPILVKIITWSYLLNPSSGATFHEITQFINDNPGWPEQKRLRLRAEFAMRAGDVSDSEVLSWFGDDTPMTGTGKMALAGALLDKKQGSKEKIDALIHEGWRKGDFDESYEKKILEDFGSRLTRDDHIARIDRLLWEEKVSPAKRLMGRMPDSYQKLYKARIALIENKKLSAVNIAVLPANLKNDPGLIFDRMRYRARKGDDKGVREMLLLAPANAPFPEKWWKYREMQVREAIGEKNYKQAQKLLANHGQMEGTGMADAIWLQGWLESEYLGKPKDAVKIFADMYKKVKYPVSKARAAYWAARAAEKADDKSEATKWYETAMDYPTTFYGQLAYVKHAPGEPLRLPSPPDIGSSARSKFEGNEVAQAIALCIEIDEMDTARRLITWMAENDEDENNIMLLAQLGQKSGNHLGVHAAKKAMQQNVVLLEQGYPTTKTPSDAVERALALAIARQESEFDPHAKSPANALGLMQLIPATAKEVARKIGESFSKDRLFEPEYNVTLGSAYLGRLTNSYDGSYILAIAAYNAGPGNVRKWIQAYGTPGNKLDDAVNWIEEIPFTETRNYVQRVLENLQVYRHIEADSAPKLALGEDLVR